MGGEPQKDCKQERNMIRVQFKKIIVALAYSVDRTWARPIRRLVRKLLRTEVDDQELYSGSENGEK